MRTSDYVIYVKLSESDKYLLIHGYTGAIDLVNKRAVERLRAGKYDSLQPSDIELLRQRGYLTQMPPSQEQERVAKLAQLFQKIDSKTQSYIFLIVYDCNFRCRYCYEGRISKNGTAWTGEVFSKEKVDAAYDAIELLSPSQIKGKEIFLYGGEPLLKKNRIVVEYIVERGIAKGCHFGAITNGYEIDGYTDIIGENGIRFLQITLDGDKIAHDKRRPLFSGSGTFEKIVSNVSLALELGARVSLRVNVDSDNLKELDALAQRIDELKWRTYKNFSCYVSPVRIATKLSARNNNTEFLLQSNCALEMSVPIYSTLRRSEVLRYLTNRKKEDNQFIVFAPPDNLLKEMIKGVMKSQTGFRLRASFCGANRGSLIFDPRGHLYSCWDVVGEPSAKVGSFFPALIVDEEQFRYWRERTIATLSPCNKCKYALFCGGGCAAYAKWEYGSFWKSHCNEFPHMFCHSARKAYEEFVLEQSNEKEVTCYETKDADSRN